MRRADKKEILEIIKKNGSCKVALIMSEDNPYDCFVNWGWRIFTSEKQLDKAWRNEIDRMIEINSNLHTSYNSVYYWIEG